MKQNIDSTRRTAVLPTNVLENLLHRMIKPGVTVLGVTVLAIATWALARDRATIVHGFEIVNAYRHDRHAFCQGLAFADGILYEGTGKYGKSSLRKVDLATGDVLQQVELHEKLFGEGITIWEDRILQLTWRSGLGIIYDKKSMKPLGTFPIRGEGWGLTHDEQHLILSNGTSVLQFLDPTTFQVIRRLTVSDRKARILNLNELEYVDHEILANVWRRDRIACISPKTGKVTRWIDLRGLTPADVRRDPEAVLNGIAYDAEKKRLFVTGKNWPKLFEIRLNRL